MSVWSFLRPKKEDQVAWIGVGGLGDSGNARKKTFFFLWCLPWCSVINPHLIIEALHNILGKTILQDKVSANTASWFPKCYKIWTNHRICIVCYRQKLTVLPGKSILCKKHLKNGYFCVQKSDLPDFGRTWTPNSWLQVNFWGGPENFGRIML